MKEVEERVRKHFKEGNIEWLINEIVTATKLDNRKNVSIADLKQSLHSVAHSNYKGDSFEKMAREYANNALNNSSGI